VLYRHKFYMLTIPVMTATICGVSAAMTNYPTMGLDRTLRVQNFEDTRISKLYAYNCGKVVSPMHRPSFNPSGNTPGTHFC